VSECVACGRHVDATPVGPSRPLCPVCRTRLGAGDPEVEAALAPEVTEERPSDAFVRQGREPSLLERFLDPRR
jgi:hypothetical protein